MSFTTVSCYNTREHDRSSIISPWRLHYTGGTRCHCCRHHFGSDYSVDESVAHGVKAAALVRNYPLISDQVTPEELQLILGELETCISRHKKGAVVEFGCYRGTSSLFIRRLLDCYADTREFHVYDSFEGLPPKGQWDQSSVGEHFVTGELLARKKEFVVQFKKAGLALPHIHKGWFHELDQSKIPQAIGFAFLDGDYYESIRDSLMLITPCLVVGAVIIVDDYANEALPGAARAVDEWLVGQQATMRVQRSLAIIYRR